ncbi:PQQ-binding-like beta-propeller repeat protein [Streptomyces sp. N35]|uniref:outer membrane protein assembly factor BamB family protein n=1 Tax=Streptomyces sp. N35 TaxID=2795730 RepID=UPI0018F7270B|nr:PQQ-binding-like beta-propeller repeat protein [Streptomyces sp. N35]
MLSLLAAVGVAGGAWMLWPGGGDVSDNKATAQPPKPGDVVPPVEKTPESIEAQLTADIEPGDGLPAGGAIVRAPGAWATEKVFAKSDAKAVYGFSAKDGLDKWKIPLPGEICAASKHITVDGMTAVLTESEEGKLGGDPGERDGCTELVAFDVDSGKTLWRKHLKEAEGIPPFAVGLTVSQGVVAVSWTEASAAFDLASGEQNWTKNAATTCKDQSFGGGSALLAVVSCGVDEKILKVQKVNPKTGKALWTYEVSKGILDARILSSDPPLVGISAGDYGVTDIASLGGDGKLRSMIRLGGDKYSVECDSFTMERCKGYAAGGDRLYVMTKDDGGLEKPANEVVEFDVATGKTTGKNFKSKGWDPLIPVRMSGGKVIAHRANQSIGAVVSLDPATGKQTLLMVHPIEKQHERLVGADSTQTLFEHGHLYFAGDQVIGPAKKGGPSETILACLYGAIT